MPLTHLRSFFRDEEASAALEYMALVGILGLVWVAAATEYKAHLMRLFAKLSRDLSHVKF